MTEEIQNGSPEKLERPYHGMQDIIFLLDKDQEYGIWYSEDQTALGFQFNLDRFKDTFVYILRDSIQINENGVSFKHEIVRNPHNVPDSIFESNEFYELLSKAMNEVVAQMLEWKRETYDA